mmetsp:Transcript_101125/g.324862  ORF Transcript_101125/g.324862 Transcript_101125/m.324862 type:complete len:200 (+) Transcript_101125:259-858(+)
MPRKSPPWPPAPAQAEAAFSSHSHGPPRLGHGRPPSAKSSPWRAFALPPAVGWCSAWPSRARAPSPQASPSRSAGEEAGALRGCAGAAGRLSESSKASRLESTAALAISPPSSAPTRSPTAHGTLCIEAPSPSHTSRWRGPRSYRPKAAESMERNLIPMEPCRGAEARRASKLNPAAGGPDPEVVASTCGDRATVPGSQ